jgi:hypothetical protein
LNAVAITAVFLGLAVVTTGLWWAIDGADRVFLRHPLRARRLDGARALWSVGAGRRRGPARSGPTARVGSAGTSSSAWSWRRSFLP